MKNKFLRSTLILIIGWLITKLLGFIIKIIYTRIVSSDSINLYSIIMPTYSLLITLAQLGLPLAISNVIARGGNSKKVLLSTITSSIIINIILISLIFLLAPYISETLLKNKDAFYPIISIAFLIPFVSLSSIIRGYFFGKQKMIPHTISNIIEQLFRLLLIIIVIPKILKYGYIFTVSVYILLNIISEIISIIVFLFYSPKKISINFKDFKPDIKLVRSVFSIALPTTSSRIIGNIGFFFEPIILTLALTSIGYSNSFILNEYGIYNTYVIPLLTIPSFFILALNTSLIPEISKNKNNKRIIKKRLLESIIFSLILGIISNTLVYIFTPNILNIIFKTNKGINYIRLLAPFFILFYIEGPLSSVLQAMNYAKYTMKVTIISIIIKLSSLFLLSLFHIGIYGLLISEILNIFVVIILNTIKIKKILY